MNIKALITTLILGSSSAAVASPTVTFSGGASVTFDSGTRVERRNPVTVIHNHRMPHAATQPCHDEPVYKPVRPVYQEPWFNPSNTTVSGSGSVYVGSIGRAPQYVWNGPRAWFNLTEATRIDSGREFFKIHGSAGQFGKLAIQNLGGRTEIAQIAIEFEGYGTQKVRFDRVLSGKQSLTLDLAHNSRLIKRVIVYGASGRGSAYQLMAL